MARVAQLINASTLVAEMGFNDLAGVNIVFINMPLREAARPNTPPQGPGLMAARLRQYGANVSIIDLNAYRILDAVSKARGLASGRHYTHEEAERLIRAHFSKHGEPDLIGISGKITTLKWQQWTARTCRELVPDAFIISGGGLATEFKTGLFNWVRDLDAIGHSEGDDIILLAALDVKRYHEQRSHTTDSPYYLGEFGGRHRFMYEGGRPPAGSASAEPRANRTGVSVLRRTSGQRLSGLLEPMALTSSASPMTTSPWRSSAARHCLRRSAGSHSAGEHIPGLTSAQWIVSSPWPKQVVSISASERRARRRKRSLQWARAAKFSARMGSNASRSGAATSSPP